MPWNSKQSAQWADKEVLKFPTGLNAVKSVVLDATDTPNTITVAVGSRNIIPAGTILKLSATNADKFVAYNGAGTIAGILARPIDILANATSSSEPAPMFYHECVFATQSIVGFTNYASALVSTLNTCKFE